MHFIDELPVNRSKWTMSL